MPSDNVLHLTQSTETVTAALAASPHSAVDQIVKGLFKSHPHHSKESPAGENELDRAAQCGKFPYRPSDLFLRIYNDVLTTLDKDPLAGLVAPSLLGTSGTVPLSICSVIPDIMTHYAHLIANAQHEVFCATNYWEPSDAVTIVTDGIRALSKNVQERGGEKVVFKLMYDRGTPSQLIKNHTVVPPDGWEKVGIPKQEEIPGVQLEVVNYHRPPLGTFHAKYLVVDRRVACVNSNNIQDRPNLEMMVHVEGPIVDSFYDMALLSWANAMNPPLPLLSHPTPWAETEYKFHWDNQNLKYIEERKEFEPTVDEATYLQRVTERLCCKKFKADATVSASDVKRDFKPYILHPEHKPVPIVMVNRNPKGMPGHDDAEHVPQDVAWISALKYAQKSVFIQSPTFNASPVVPAVMDACRRGVIVTLYVSLGYNDIGEMIPFQGGTNEYVANKMITTLIAEGEGKQDNLKFHWYTAKDQVKPIGASEKKRSSHVKFMSIDDQIAILGNGNQDTQSWFHSQEINIMIDSPDIVRAMVSGINANQNTSIYGAVGKEDGIWRDKEGNVVQSSGIAAPGPMGIVKGFGGAIARVRGTGGF
ncbi:hypothetical protein BD410DRAFT_797330 [Rickenella mellea]|uniref:PLD phosphodiesterase domain-containing protein n=1 Tax=Rickenella mellea TaxID=50990 RepID=A0A4Y7PFC4_9AGAM|nr:hypothetical protein BD410DRAFT_797330 [Rickenella mellea]